VTVCPPRTDAAPPATDPPTSRRRARAALVPVTSARAQAAHRLHRLGGAAALTLLLATACGTATGSATSPTSSPNAGVGVGEQAAEPPSVFAWYANGGIHFAHTEVSDRTIADLLTSKKDSPVIYVPQLAEVPAAATSPVYIFSNGIQPEHRGPLGFQGDVFPTAPGDAQYSPLRSLEMVTWTNPGTARELTAAADVLAAQKAGELSLTSPGIIINMPFLDWPSGHR